MGEVVMAKVLVLLMAICPRGKSEARGVATGEEGPSIRLAVSSDPSRNRSAIKKPPDRDSTHLLPRERMDSRHLLDNLLP